MDLANAYRYLWGATTGSFPRNEIHYILRCKDDVEWRQELATITNAIFKMRQEDSDLATVVKWGVTDLIDSTHSLLLWLDMPDIPGFRQLTRDPCIDHHSFAAAFVADVVMEYGHYDYIVLWWSGRQPERSTEQKIRGLTAMVQSHVVQLMYFISSWYGIQGDLKLREILTAGHHLQDNGLTALEDAIQLMGPLLQVVQKTHSVLFVLESPFDGVSPEETNRMVESLRHWIHDANEELYTRDDVKVLVTGSGWRDLRGNNALKASERLCYMPVQVCISDQETALGEARELVRGALFVGEKEESERNYHADWDGDGSG